MELILPKKTKRWIRWKYDKKGEPVYFKIVPHHAWGDKYIYHLDVTSAKQLPYEEIDKAIEGLKKAQKRLKKLFDEEPPGFDYTDEHYDNLPPCCRENIYFWYNKDLDPGEWRCKDCGSQLDELHMEQLDQAITRFG